MTTSAKRLDWLATVLPSLQGTLIVSCQAREGEPLRDPAIMAAMAKSVVMGGASAVRANGPDDIRAIRQIVTVPIFGVFKRSYADSPIYITPTRDEAEQIAAAGCDVLTVEATARPRPHGETLEDFLQRLRADFDLPIMADVSTREEGIRAAALGADLIATTLAGYTPYSQRTEGPDLVLVEELAPVVNVPIIAEGRISSPSQARQALERGAYAVVVGSMITRPSHITTHFVRGMAP